MNNNELLSLFQRVASEAAEKEIGNVELNSDIADLGIDSLAMLEIVAAMERELDVMLPDDSLAGVVTVSDLVELIATRKAAA